jgi:dihydrofolate reductase
MNVVLVMVETADGKTTLWHEPHVHGWSSAEDQANFHALIESHSLIVMGSNTYVAVKNHIRLSSKTRRIVMTTRPGDFANDAVKDQLEFTDESPGELVKRLSKEGHETLLLVGGSQINGAFLKQNLITDCILTIEPRFVGNGNSLFAPINVDIPLTLTEVKRLNTQGTLLIRYKVNQ